MRSWLRLTCLLLVAAVGCGGRAPAADSAVGRPACDPKADRACFRIDSGDKVIYRVIPSDRATSIDDGGRSRTVVPLTALIDATAVGNPAGKRFKFYATDGFTHGGHATWENLQHGYIEVETRKLIFDASQELPHSFRIKDAFRVEVLIE
jgi:hypothetical protein